MAIPNMPLTLGGELHLPVQERASKSRHDGSSSGALEGLYLKPGLGPPNFETVLLEDAPAFGID